MKSIVLAFAIGAAVAALGLPALAEQAVKPSQGNVASTAPLASPATPLRGRQDNAEPKELAGILLKQNEQRARLGLPLLTWSQELADTTRKSIADATVKTCTLSAARRAKGAASMNFFWAGGIRNMTGETRPQDITPAFVVSEWAKGRSAWDAASQTCRRTAAGASNCQDYAHITLPAARTLGCVRQLCPSQGQIWACSYGKPAAPTPAPAKP